MGNVSVPKAEAGKIVCPSLCMGVYTAGFWEDSLQDHMSVSVYGCVLQDEGQGPGFEARVVVLVESMIPRSTWRGPERLMHGSPFRGMSLLHLAAAQGYARLIETLSQWR